VAVDDPSGPRESLLDAWGFDASHVRLLREDAVVLTADFVDTQPRGVRVVGEVRGADIAVFWDALAAAVEQGDQRVVLDLSELESWSLVAQAMVLQVARQLASRGRHLVLVAPSQRLRDHDNRLNVFGTVDTLPAAHGGRG